MRFLHVRKIHMLSDLGSAVYLHRQETYRSQISNFKPIQTRVSFETGTVFSTEKIDGNKSLYAYADIYKDLRAAQDKFSGPNRKIEEILNEAKVTWEAQSFIKVWEALSGKSIFALRSFPHCPVFKTPVICRKAAKNSIAPSRKFLSAMSETPGFIRAPNQTSLSFVSPRFAKDARAYICNTYSFIMSDSGASY